MNQSNKEKDLEKNEQMTKMRETKVKSRKTTSVRMTRKSRRLSYLVSFVIALHHTMSASQIECEISRFLVFYSVSSIKNINLWAQAAEECICVCL